MSISLDVSGLILDDMSDNQAICGIRLFFSHGQIGNLRMTLTSPSGQSVELVGPGTLNSGLSSFIDWNVLFTPCMTPAAPDAGFSDVWDNDQAWASFNLYDGVYYPFGGCLEDFDTGSANGVWTLDIENLGTIDGTIDFFEIIFCDPTGSICDPCFLDAGDMQQEFFTTCQQDIQLRNLDPFLNPDFIINQNLQGYAYALIEGDNIIAIEDNILESDTLSPGSYMICGIAYDLIDAQLISGQGQYSELQELISNGSVCADVTDPCFTLVISPVDNILSIDTTLCMGDTLSFFGIQIFDDLDTNILRTNQVTCDSLISIKSTMVLPSAVIDASALSTECGESVFLNGSQSDSNTGNISYNWTTNDGRYVNDIGPIAEVDSSGYYILEVQSDNCTDTVGVQITSVDTFMLGIDITSPLCVGDTFDVRFDIDVDALLVDGPSVIDINEDGFRTLDEGVYVLATTVGSCRRIDTINLVSQAAIIDIQVSSTTIDCDSTISRTTASTNAINPIFNYEGDELILDSTAMIDINTPGIYSVTVTDENGCSEHTSFIVQGSAELPSFITQDVNVNCNDPFMPLPLELNSVVDSVVWTGPGGFRSIDINPVPIDTGIYIVTVYPPSGCDQSRMISYNVMNVSPSLMIVGDALTCNRDTAEICVVGNDLEVEWIYNNAVVSDSACISTDLAGIYMANVIDMNGCTGSGTYDLIEILDIDITISNFPDSIAIACDDPIPMLEPILSQNNLPLSYTWSLDNMIVSDSLNYTPDTIGLYTLEVRDMGSGCVLNDTVIINQISSQLNQNNIIIIGDNIECPGDSSDISINGIDLEDIELYINEQLVPNPSNIRLAEGEYDFLFIDSLGCNVTLPLTISAEEPFVLELGDDVSAPAGDLIDLNVLLSIPLSNIQSMTWSDTTIIDCTFCTDPVITVAENQLLSLTVVDENGCVQSDSIRINVLDSSSDSNIYAPNVFYPSGIDDNRSWQLYLPDGNVKFLELRIYDRWGNLVTFRSDSAENIDFTWDGTYDGSDAEQGVYVFIAKYLDDTNRESLITGQITLLR